MVIGVFGGCRWGELELLLAHGRFSAYFWRTCDAYADTILYLIYFDVFGRLAISGDVDFCLKSC